MNNKIKLGTEMFQVVESMEDSWMQVGSLENRTLSYDAFRFPYRASWFYYSGRWIALVARK